jgi:hypothetical protein
MAPGKNQYDKKISILCFYVPNQFLTAFKAYNEFNKPRNPLFSWNLMAYYCIHESPGPIMTHNATWFRTFIGNTYIW